MVSNKFFDIFNEKYHIYKKLKYEKFLFLGDLKNIKQKQCSMITSIDSLFFGIFTIFDFI